VYSLGRYTSEEGSDRETPRGGASWLEAPVTQLEMHVRMNRIAKVIHDMIGPPFLLDGVRFVKTRIGVSFCLEIFQCLWARGETRSDVK